MVEGLATACRKCRAPLAKAVERCPGCECRAPFSCAVCNRPLSGLSVGRRPTLTHPWGALSRDGLPLCHEHRIARCVDCGTLLPVAELTRCELGRHLDRETRKGMPPRIEPVFGYRCERCSQAPTHELRGEFAWLLAALLVSGVALTAGLLTLLR